MDIGQCKMDAQANTHTHTTSRRALTHAASHACTNLSHARHHERCTCMRACVCASVRVFVCGVSDYITYNLYTHAKNPLKPASERASEHFIGAHVEPVRPARDSPPHIGITSRAARQRRRQPHAGGWRRPARINTIRYVAACCVCESTACGTPVNWIRRFCFIYFMWFLRSAGWFSGNGMG